MIGKDNIASTSLPIDASADSNRSKQRWLASPGFHIGLTLLGPTRHPSIGCLVDPIRPFPL
jgi:hypothetical protein